jgi:hypothetical protein
MKDVANEMIKMKNQLLLELKNAQSHNKKANVSISDIKS